MSQNDWRVSQAATEAVARAAAQAARAQSAFDTRPRKRDKEDAGGKAADRLPYGQVKLISIDERRHIRARLDEGHPLVFGGYGGWEDEPRPGQVSATIFRGAPAPQLQLRLILGGWPRVPRWSDPDRDIRMLDHFARLPIDGPGNDRPPLIRVRGQVPHHHRRWFVENLEWGEVDVVRGKRVRAFVTVTLRMFVPVELVAERKRRNPRPTKAHVVRRGERLEDIVRDKLGVKGARETNQATAFVKRLNGMRAGERLREGRRVKLPVGNWWRNEIAANASRLAARNEAASNAARDESGGR